MNLKAIADILAKLIQARKKKLAPRKTGALANSIKEFVLITKDKITISSKMNDYGYFQDSGVRGSKKKLKNGLEPKPFNNRFTRKSNMSLYEPGQYKNTYAGEWEKGKPFDYWRAQVGYYGFKPQPFIIPAVTQVMDETGTRLLGNAIADNIALEFKKL